MMKHVSKYVMVPDQEYRKLQERGIHTLEREGSIQTPAVPAVPGSAVPGSVGPGAAAPGAAAEASLGTREWGSLMKSAQVRVSPVGVSPVGVSPAGVSPAGVSTEGGVAQQVVQDMMIDDVATMMPKSYRQRAKSLLTYLMRQGVSYNDRGEVTFQETTIPLSSVVDLIRDALIESKTLSPHGVEDFVALMAKVNTPLSMVSNQTRRKELFISPEEKKKKKTATLPIWINL